MITLVDIRRINQVDACDLTWRLLQERPPEANISHTGNTTRGEHDWFVANHPYRVWQVVYNAIGEAVGTVLLTRNNEVGVAILKEHQRKGYARAALVKLMEQNGPAPGEKAQRTGYFLANVNPNNIPSLALFDSLGGKIVQWTFRL